MHKSGLKVASKNTNSKIVPDLIEMLEKRRDGEQSAIHSFEE